jgi:ABC-2 type transport system ATP-binding protein
MENVCREYYHIHTDNDSMAVAVLQEKLHITQFDVEENGSIRLYEGLDDVRQISKTLYDNGIIPLELSVNEANLEQYYMNMVGGEENVEHNKSTELPVKKR